MWESEFQGILTFFSKFYSLMGIVMSRAMSAVVTLSGEPSGNVLKFTACDYYRTEAVDKKRR